MYFIKADKLNIDGTPNQLTCGIQSMPCWFDHIRLECHLHEVRETEFHVFRHRSSEPLDGDKHFLPRVEWPLPEATDSPGPPILEWSSRCRAVRRCPDGLPAIDPSSQQSSSGFQLRRYMRPGPFPGILSGGGGLTGVSRLPSWGAF